MARLEVRRLLIPLAPVAGGCKSPSVHSRLADLSVKVPRDVTPGFAEIQFLQGLFLSWCADGELHPGLLRCGCCHQKSLNPDG